MSESGTVKIFSETTMIPIDHLFPNDWNHLSSIEAAWLAGYIDGDGSIGMGKNRVVQVQFETTNKITAEHIGNLLSKMGIRNRIFVYHRRRKDGRGFYKPEYIWTVQRVLDCYELLTDCLPYFVEKHAQAESALKQLTLKIPLLKCGRGVNARKTGAEDEVYGELKVLNHTGELAK